MTTNTIRARLVGLLASLGLLAIVIGVPVLLFAVGPNPFTGALSPHELPQTLSGPDDGTVAYGLIKIVAWIAWAVVTLAVLLEIAARLRGVHAPQLRGLGIAQQGARGLVGSAMLLFVAIPGIAQATTPAAHAEPPAAAPIAHSQPVAAGPAAASSNVTPVAHARSGVGAAASTVRHRVEPGDSLYDLAHRYLGDGNRYQEIVAANRNVIGDKPSVLQPGWVLTIPTTHDPAAATPGTGTAGVENVKVAPGDTLSEIALDQLGDADRYPEIANLTRPIAQPGGAHLTNPDFIVDGWTVKVPTGHQQQPDAGQQQPDAGQQQPDAGQQEDQQQGQQQRGSGHDAPAPAPMPATPSQAAPSQAAPSQASTGHVAEDGSGQEDSARSPWVTRTVWGAGSILALGVIALIARRRREQQRRRRPGQSIPTPSPEAVAVEQELETIADPLPVETVDVALRTLAATCAHTGTPLPEVRAARLTATQFDLYLATPAQLPTPWAGTADHTVWTLNVADTADLAAINTSDLPAPYPALVAIGHDDEAGHVLLNLEYLGALAITGEDIPTREILAALAIELATSSWADDLQVTLVGAFPELEDTLQTGRIRYLPSVGRILEDLLHRADQDRAALADSGATTLSEARVTGATPDAWPPEIILLAGETTTRQRNQLAQLVDELPRVALATITTGDTRVGEWALEQTPGDPDSATLAPINLHLQPQRLPAEQYGHILEDVALTDVDELIGEPVPEPTLEDLKTVTPIDEPDVVTPAPLTEPTEDAPDGARSDVAARHDDVDQSDSADEPDTPYTGAFLPDDVRAESGLGSDAAASDEPDLADADDVAPEPVGAAPTNIAVDDEQTTNTDTSADLRDNAPPAATSPDDARADAPPDDARPTTDDSSTTEPDAETLPASTGEPAASSEAAPTASSPDSATVAPAEGGEVRVLPAPAPRLLLLGVPDVINVTGPVEKSRRKRLLEYAAFLVTHPGSTHVAVDDAVWPNRSSEDNSTTRHPATNRLRKWFGTDPNGEEYLPRHQAEDAYAFLPTVTCDIVDWDRLIAGDALAASTEDLEAALDLITSRDEASRGVPFKGVHPRNYAWAQVLKTRLVSEVVNASSELARRLLMDGRWQAAAEAATIGLEMSPAHEPLWRTCIRAAHMSRDPKAEENTINRLLMLTAELEVDLEPETEELLDALKHPGADLAALLADAH